MSRAYLVLISILAIATLFMVIDSKSRNRDIMADNLKLIKVTTLNEPSFLVSELEDRFRYLRGSINRVYIGMPKIDKLGYIYAK